MSIINLFVGWMSTAVITHDIGWWSLNSFSTTSIQFNKTSNAGLLNPYMKGDLVVKGTLNLDPKSSGTPEIEKFHVSQHFEMRNEEQIGIITVSPVVTYKRTSTPNSESQPIPFEQTIPISVHSWQWGTNKIVFVSGTQSHEITFGQVK